MRPMFPYFGSKFNLSKRYGRPPYPIVIEPFAGSAAYSLYWGVQKAVLVDANEIICELWDYLIHVKESEIEKLPIKFDHINDLKLPVGARHLLGFWIAKGVATPRKSPSAWQREWGKTFTSCNVWGNAAKYRIARQLDGIRYWKIIQGSYEQSPDIKATWFVDPPYEKAGKNYPHCNIDYISLALWIKTRKGKAIICENAGATWLDFKKFHTVAGTKGKHRSGVSEEVVAVLP